MNSKAVPDVLLAFCPPRKIYYPPIETAYLATNLETKGFKVQICDINLKLFQDTNFNFKRLWHKTNEHQWHNYEKMNELFRILENQIDKLIGYVLNSKAPVICFIIEYPNEIFTCKLLRILKERNIQKTIIAGGTGCASIAQRKFLVNQSSGAIDYFAVGDTELSVAEIVKVVRFGAKPAKFNDADAINYRFAKNLTMTASDLDKIAYPTFKEFDIRHYIRKCLAVKWSRGCPENCLFCRQKISEIDYRFRSVNSIMDELHHHFNNYGLRNFSVLDSPVNGCPDYLERVCEEIINSSLNISWSAKAIPLSSLTNRLLGKMRAAGCHTLVFCIESGCDELMSTMGRTIQSKTAEKVIRRTHAAGIKVAINIVVGFPGEYNRKFEETQEFLRRNPHPIINHLYMTSTLQVNRGTPLHQRADQFGLIFSEIEPQNRWYTLDGNTYAIRKQRQHEILNLALSLRMEVGHTFLENPAKEQGLINKFNPIYRWKKFLYHSYRGHESLETVNSNLHLRIFARIVSHFTLISESEEFDIPLIESIREGSKSFIGPEVIHLDLTNRCNMNCIACWDRSPLVLDRSIHNDHLKKTLPFEIIKGLIDDLIQLKGLHQIKLGGGGEPTMHPNFKEILAYVRKKDRYVRLEINSNFSLMDEELIKLMIEFEVDLLTISLWAGTSDVYRRTHPNQSKGSFDRIVENIKKLVEMRKSGFPRISIHNVIMNLNYQDVDAMLELALDLEADEINYVLIDPVPGKTEQLLLNQDERQALLENFNRIKQRTDRFIVYVEPVTGRSIRVANLYELIQKLSMSSTERGIYDKKAVDKIPCYIGWLYTRIMADGKVAPCCKGHRLPMGDLNKSRFKEIWYSPKYMQFRYNGITLKKSAPYFLVMGNDSSSQIGCYNCDNIMHNLVMHEKFLCYSNYYKWVKFELSKWNTRFFTL